MGSTVGIIALLLAIALLMYLCYNNISTVFVCVVCAILIAVFNGLPVWEAVGETFVAGFAGTVQSYVLIFMASAAYATIMESSGATITIGRTLVKLFGTKNALIVGSLVFAVLNYGGISLWVVMFAAGPILYYLFNEADIPRHFCMACLSIGAITWTMTCLPGSTALTNVIPTQYLGTTLTAAPVLSIIATLMLMVMQVFYLKFALKKSRDKGEHWEFPEGYDPARYNDEDTSKTPGVAQAFAPIVLLLVMIIGSNIAKLPIASNSTLLVVLSMACAFVLCLVLNYKYMDKKALDVIGKGAMNGFAAMIGLCALVGFGRVVQSTEAFQSVVAWLLGLDISIYFKGVISSATIAGITASSSGGVRIALESLGDYFVNSGCNLGILHRLMSIAAGTLDSLPQSSGWPAMFAFFGLTFKDGYKHCFWISVVMPAIVVIILTAAVTIMGL